MEKLSSTSQKSEKTLKILGEMDNDTLSGAFGLLVCIASVIVYWEVNLFPMMQNGTVTDTKFIVEALKGGLVFILVFIMQTIITCCSIRISLEVWDRIKNHWIVDRYIIDIRDTIHRYAIIDIVVIISAIIVIKYVIKNVVALEVVVRAKPVIGTLFCSGLVLFIQLIAETILFIQLIALIVAVTETKELFQGIGHRKDQSLQS